MQQQKNCLLSSQKRISDRLTQLVCIWAARFGGKRRNISCLVDAGYQGQGFMKWVMDTYRWILEVVRRPSDALMLRHKCLNVGLLNKRQGSRELSSRGDSSNGDSTPPEREPLIRSGGLRPMFRSASQQFLKGSFPPAKKPPSPCLFVERSFGWFNWCGRSRRDYEILPQTHETFVQIAMIRLMLRRLA